MTTFYTVFYKSYLSIRCQYWVPWRGIRTWLNSHLNNGQSHSAWELSWAASASFGFIFGAIWGMDAPPSGEDQPARVAIRKKFENFALRKSSRNFLAVREIIMRTLAEVEFFGITSLYWKYRPHFEDTTFLARLLFSSQFFVILFIHWAIVWFSTF
jgi:hypothetical protein